MSDTDALFRADAEWSRVFNAAVPTYARQSPRMFAQDILNKGEDPIACFLAETLLESEDAEQTIRELEYRLEDAPNNDAFDNLQRENIELSDEISETNTYVKHLEEELDSMTSQTKNLREAIQDLTAVFAQDLAQLITDALPRREEVGDELEQPQDEAVPGSESVREPEPEPEPESVRQNASKKLVEAGRILGPAGRELLLPLIRERVPDGDEKPILKNVPDDRLGDLIAAVEAVIREHAPEAEAA